MNKNQTRGFFLILPLAIAAIFMSSCSRQVAMTHSTSQQLAIVQSSNGHRIGATVVKPETMPVAIETTTPVLEEIQPITPQAKTESPKMNFIQKKMAKMAIAKIGNKVAANKPVISKSTSTEHGARLEYGLRLALVLIIVGAIISVFGWPFYALGSLLILIGLIFLVLWLVDMD